MRDIRTAADLELHHAVVQAETSGWPEVSDQALTTISPATPVVPVRADC